MAESNQGLILIIDDTEVNRYSVGRILSRSGYRIMEASTCAEGLRHVSKKPDLIILDVQLPDGNGYGLCASLKANPHTATIPVLMTSASFVEARDKAHGLDSGADGYLTTPIDALELVATVKALIRVRVAEEKLRKSQEIFRTMVDSIPALVWMSGLDKKCYYFNKAWLDFTGQAVAHETGDGWVDGVHEDDRARCMESYATAFDKREPFETTYRLRRRDGDYHWLLVRGEPHYALDGNFIGYTGACIDIHDKLSAELRLKNSEERFDLAVKGMNDGLWDWNLHTDNIYYSPRYKTMLGYDGTEFFNTVDEWRSRIHPEDREKVEETLRQYLAGETLKYKSVYRMRHRDGSWRWVLSRAVALWEDGAAYRMVGGHTDITEQKELEYALREAYQKAEAANNTKTEFLANMSHEIRTPMNAIVGLSNILATTPLSEQQKEFITTLQLSAETLLTLINDMLDIAKIEDNMIELEYIPFSLRHVIERIVSMMSVKANEKGLKLDVRYADDAADGFSGDPLRIQQVIVNLVNNAIKFTPSGSVSIIVSDDAGGHSGMRKVTIRIADTGIGIPKEKHYAVFEKFTQGDSSITRKYGGSGLGLSISKALIERMGGNIHLSSEEGKGSVFTLNLPLILAQDAILTKEADMMPQQQDHTPGQPKKRVLLVEDYAPNILVATTLLEEFGYDYDSVTNGIEALEKINAQRYDIVLMDVQMHGMDGFETTRRIRDSEKKEQREPLCIIAMTAHALTGDRERCLSAGMSDYISKPFNPHELRLKLEAHINGQGIG